MEILIGDLREGVLDIWDRSKKKSAEARQAYADEKVPPPKDGHGRNLTGPLLKDIFDTKLTKGWLKKGKTRAYHDNSGPNKSQRMTGKPAKSLTTCPNSPDLNVIEDFWNMLSMRCVRARGSVSPLSSNSSLSLFALSVAQSARPHALSERQGAHCDQPGPGHRGRFLHKCFCPSNSGQFSQFRLLCDASEKEEWIKCLRVSETGNTARRPNQRWSVAVYNSGLTRASPA